ncbi:hypothetical protein F2Q70_00032167 [Brassica cretica]|uniref:DYW domain-containing protein n=1 Tax=Brassica cretica TaxID=69181 RepID=A0A8S9FGJ0_BRACR|nr:hypothetical protein F2Q70_00032167 [Brassica cretica]
MYCKCGCLETALEVFEKLSKRNVFSWAALIGGYAAYGYGFLQEGRGILDNMEGRYDISPQHEHYSCIVDLMCRAGRLDEAVELIEEMPMKPLASVWGALLNEEAALVQLSSIYMTAQRNGEASKIRQMIGQRGIRKVPGCSVLEHSLNKLQLLSVNALGFSCFYRLSFKRIEREEFLNMLQFYIMVKGVIGLPEVGAGNLSKALKNEYLNLSQEHLRAL